MKKTIYTILIIVILLVVAYKVFASVLPAGSASVPVRTLSVPVKSVSPSVKVTSAVLATAGKTKITESEVDKLILTQVPPTQLYKMQKAAVVYMLQKVKSTGKVTYYIQEPLFNHIDAAGHPYLGPADAKVLVIQFLDFQCPFCKAAVSTVDTIAKQYPDKVKLITINFPLPFHNNALVAANAAMCAQEQNKYWPFYHAVFADQTKLATNDLKATAKKLGMNTNKFNKCLDDQKYNAQVQQDIQIGRQNSVNGTPTFIVDGRMSDSYQTVLGDVTQEVKIKYPASK